VTSPSPTDGSLLPSDDPGWDGYGETILEVHGSTIGEVDLASPIGVREIAIFAGAGLAGTFGILTAENPRGLPASPEENARRRALLQAELEEQGVTAVRIDGLSRDRVHREIGVAIRWPMQRVIYLARKWHQSAIYWFDGHDVWLIGALTVAPPIRLPAR
jgi:hypothetical protein